MGRSLLKNIGSKLAVVALFAIIVNEPLSATELSLSGTWTYQYSGPSVVLSSDRINNLATAGTSGSLKLELWAFGSPFKGGSQLGYQLASYQLSPLDSGFSYTDVSSGTVSATRPPVGTWYLALLLTEWSGESWITRFYALSESSQTMICSNGSCFTATADSSAASVSIATNRSTFSVNSDDVLRLSAIITAGTSIGQLSDIYISASLDLGISFYLNPNLEWDSTFTPAAIDFPIVDLSAPDFYSIPIAGLPEGNYQFSFILNVAGSDPNNTNSRIAYSAATTQFRPPPPPGSEIVFNPPVVHQANIDNFFEFDFYPYAFGGVPPYHFALDTFGGFPPTGLILDVYGVLSGFPSIEGSRTFLVCAIDLVANQSCAEVTVSVSQTEPDLDAGNDDPDASNTYYFANWSCGSSSGCAALMGANQGSTGLFCSVSDCNAWGNKFIPSGYSCSVTATNNSPSIGAPANGVCAISGVDF